MTFEKIQIILCKYNTAYNIQTRQKRLIIIHNINRNASGQMGMLKTKLLVDTYDMSASEIQSLLNYANRVMYIA